MVTNLSYATHIKQVAKMKATSSLNISWCSLGKEWNNLIWNSLLYLDVILFLPCTIFKMFTASVPVCATHCLFCFVFQVEGGKTNLRNCRPRNLWNRGKLRNLKKWLFFLQLLLASRRKETRGIDLNTVGREDNEGINGACRHFSSPLYIHHAVRTECLRPPQIYSYYKRIIPSLT